MAEVVEQVEEEVKEKRTPRKPSEFLNARIHLMRRTFGTVNVPTVDDLLKHAEKFGTECVLETAAELGYGLETVMRVCEFCDRIDVMNGSRYRKAKLKPIDVRCKALLGIEDDAEVDTESQVV